MTRRVPPKIRRRLAFAGALILGCAIAALLVGTALKDNLLYFYTPTQAQAQIQANTLASGTAFRLGGIVAPGSVAKADGTLRFIVTDERTQMRVRFSGLPPALFAEGQGVVATGRIGTDGIFAADEILAKHDEKYMPPDVVEKLKRSGHWQDGEKYGYGK